MPENGTLKVKLHNLIKDHSFLFHENNPYLDNETNTKLYILDGQQRMTSIAKLFLACDSQYQYYYDLSAILVDKFPNDEVENDSAFSKRTKSIESLCRAYKIGEKCYI